MSFGTRRQLVALIAELGDALRSGDLETARAVLYGLGELLQTNGASAEATDLAAEHAQIRVGKTADRGAVKRFLTREGQVA